MTSETALTKVQTAVLGFVREELGRGRSPTIREIAEHFGQRTTSSAHLHVRNLERAGFLKRGYGHRSIELVREKTHGLRLLGTVAAGSPIEAVEQQELIEVGTQYQNDDHYVLRVRGDSMIEDCIADGDYVVVRKQQTCVNGDLVVARLDGDVTLKRFYREKRRIRLQPANRTMKPIYCRDVAIEGVVVGVHRVMG